MTAAVRERVILTEALVLATGGIAGGGLIGRADGRLAEPLLDLPVEAPPAEAWLSSDPFDPAGHPLEAAGIRTDADLRPVDSGGRVVLDNVARRRQPARRPALPVGAMRRRRGDRQRPSRGGDPRTPREVRE